MKLVQEVLLKLIFKFLKNQSLKKSKSVLKLFVD